MKKPSLFENEPQDALFKPGPDPFLPPDGSHRSSGARDEEAVQRSKEVIRAAMMHIAGTWEALAHSWNKKVKAKR